MRAELDALKAKYGVIRQHVKSNEQAVLEAVEKKRGYVEEIESLKVAKASVETELKQLKITHFSMEKRVQDQTTRISNQVK